MFRIKPSTKDYNYRNKHLLQAYIHDQKANEQAEGRERECYKKLSNTSGIGLRYS